MKQGRITACSGIWEILREFYQSDKTGAWSQDGCALYQVDREYHPFVDQAPAC